MLIYLSVAVIYLVITLGINRGLGTVEKKLAIPGFAVKEQIR